MRKYLYAALVVTLAVGVAVAVLLYVQHPIRSAADLWNRPWEEVRPLSEEICTRYARGSDYFEQCMAVERESHRLLQGDFGLAAEEAETIKQDCASFQYFTPQLKCIEDELERRGT